MAFLTKTYIKEDGKIVGAKMELGDGRSVVMMNDDYPDEIVPQALAHCSHQKIGDGASGFSAAKDYLGAYQKMVAIRDNLVNNLWSSRATPGISDLVQAFANITGKSLSEAQGEIDLMEEDTFEALKKEKPIKAEIARIKYERAQAQATGEFDLSKYTK